MSMIDLEPPTVVSLPSTTTRANREISQGGRAVHLSLDMEYEYIAFLLEKYAVFPWATALP